MKLFIMVTLLLLLSVHSVAQQSFSDSRAIINLQKNDTTEVIAFAYLGNQQPQNDSAVKYARQGLMLAKKLNLAKALWVKQKSLIR